jgi:AMMECR1 domain-containing protein
MNILAQYACVEGLKIKPSPYFEFPNLKGYFGAFVSVKRSTKLDSYPFDTHGCIGYWSNDYQELRDFLISKIAMVARQATNHDDRKTYFTDDLTEDSNAEYIVYLMKLPVMVIDTASGIMENGQKFNNKDYGLIVQGQSGNRATYLPEVYPDQSWTNIKKLLEDKAGNTGPSWAQDPTRSQGLQGYPGQAFYAYQCDIYSTSIINTIRETIIPLIKSYCTRWITDNYKGLMPYQSVLSGNVWKIQFDKTQLVRNIASIYDYLNNLNLSNGLVKSMSSEILQYKKDIPIVREHFQEGALALLAL